MVSTCIIVSESKSHILVKEEEVCSPTWVTVQLVVEDSGQRQQHDMSKINFLGRGGDG